jgi:hypothetical protein
MNPHKHIVYSRCQNKNIFSFPYFNGNHLGEQGVDGRIILRWIFRKWDEGVWTGSIWLRIGTDGGHL